MAGYRMAIVWSSTTLTLQSLLTSPSRRRAITSVAPVLSMGIACPATSFSAAVAPTSWRNVKAPFPFVAG
jgi:hypothetical protein